MSYELHEEFTSPNSTPNSAVAAVFGLPRNVQFITIHHWGDPSWNQTWSGVVTYLCDSERANPTSAHYVAEAGRVACIVTPDDAAWHAGTAVGNAISVGIECHPRESDGDYQTVAELIKFLRGIYGDIPLRPHNYWFNTECPGTYNLARLDSLARGNVVPIASGAPSAPAPRPPAPQAQRHNDSEIHWVVESGDTLSGISTYYYGSPDKVNQIADYNGITDPSNISVGQKVFIPGPMVWLIEAPDTIRSVAAYYALDPGYLASINGLAGPDAEIYIGNTLRIL